MFETGETEDAIGIRKNASILIIILMVKKKKKTAIRFVERRK